MLAFSTKVLKSEFILQPNRYNNMLRRSQKRFVKIVMGTDGYCGKHTKSKNETIKNTLNLIKLAHQSQDIVYVGTHNSKVIQFCQNLNYKDGSELDKILIAHLHPASSTAMQAKYFMMIANETSKNTIGPYVNRRKNEALQSDQSIFENINTVIAKLIQYTIQVPIIKNIVKSLIELPFVKQIPNIIFSKMFLVKEADLIHITKDHLQQGIRPWICASQYEFIQPSQMGELIKLIENEYNVFQTLQTNLTKAQQKNIIIALRMWLLPDKEESINDLMIQLIIKLHKLGYETIIFDWEGPEKQAAILSIIKSCQSVGIDVDATVRGRDIDGMSHLKDLIKVKSKKLLSK